jgi:hypothetical protein
MQIDYLKSLGINDDKINIAITRFRELDREI